ncbi:MAG: bifunctional phosphoribosylaminoimidazolecarboxamide formyltransferase/IMP cyclohydrolase [Muribaculaceae bacterium]|nr:bifunctional phosphoribosylaminoimidazolecarboxamide formyltransferase/IMP cyclohydrolase [Muribaculaceae bacterium]
MADLKRINTALISVFHKEGLGEMLELLTASGVRLLSTGGTREFIEGLGYSCDAVEELTGYPSILGGRVKTLHPKVFGGILCRRDLDTDRRQTREYAIPEIDLVVVDLYPFAATVSGGAGEAEVIEKIDIGGISLIRAAAKNFHDVAIVASRGQYGTLLEIMRGHGEAATTLAERRLLAREAWAVTSAYDSHIFNYFDGGARSHLRVAADGAKALRYGENPHQAGSFHGYFDAQFTQLHGKEISYNNLLDIDAAARLIGDVAEPAFAIIKHNNACGLAVRPVLADAFADALAGDPVSAFGGVQVANREVDEATALLMNKVFIEVCIAPGYTPRALEILQEKKNRIILVMHTPTLPLTELRSALGGVLLQERDSRVECADDLHLVSREAMAESQAKDLLLANIVVKHSKSNAIVLVRDGMLLASGVGQTSRVDALKQAIAKAREHGHSLQGAVMASDAFFPFADCVQLAHEAGIAAVVQPGGSVRDQESIDYCNEHGMVMAMTGVRHFRH